MTEKVKVPDWFDKWYRSISKDGLNDIQLIRLISNLTSGKIKFLDEDASKFQIYSVNSNERLKFIKAIINGYEVEEQKFVLPMEGTSDDGTISESVLYAFQEKSTGRWFTSIRRAKLPELGNYLEVTQSQLDGAPAWVKAIKPVPIDDPDYGIGIYS